MDDTTKFTHIFVNSPIDGMLYSSVMKALKNAPEIEQCGVLSLITYGGIADDAYRIGRFLQMKFKNLLVHVPSVCASAGTLLVCSANTLLIGALSELGPLDAQIRKSDELYGRRSSLVVRSVFENLGQHAFDLHTSLVENIIAHSQGTIKYRTAAHVAGEMVVGLLDGLYAQISPEQIGEDYRFLKIAEEYGTRLAQVSGNISEDDLKKLVYDYPSHDFIIDFREAVGLFNEVKLPSATLSAELADETNTPLRPLSGKDRVVRVTAVNGSPIYGTKTEAGETADDSNSKAQD